MQRPFERLYISQRVQGRSDDICRRRGICGVCGGVCGSGLVSDLSLPHKWERNGGKKRTLGRPVLGCFDITDYSTSSCAVCVEGNAQPQRGPCVPILVLAGYKTQPYWVLYLLALLFLLLSSTERHCTIQYNTIPTRHACMHPPSLGTYIQGKHRVRLSSGELIINVYITDIQLCA